MNLKQLLNQLKTPTDKAVIDALALAKKNPAKYPSIQELAGKNIHRFNLEPVTQGPPGAKAYVSQEMKDGFAIGDMDKDGYIDTLFFVSNAIENEFKSHGLDINNFSSLPPEASAGILNGLAGVVLHEMDHLYNQRHPVGKEFNPIETKPKTPAQIQISASKSNSLKNSFKNLNVLSKLAKDLRKSGSKDIEKQVNYILKKYAQVTAQQLMERLIGELNQESAKQGQTSSMLPVGMYIDKLDDQAEGLQDVTPNQAFSTPLPAEFASLSQGVQALAKQYRDLLINPTSYNAGQQNTAVERAESVSQSPLDPTMDKFRKARDQFLPVLSAKFNNDKSKTDSILQKLHDIARAKKPNFSLPSELMANNDSSLQSLARQYIEAIMSGIPSNEPGRVWMPTTTSPIPPTQYIGPRPKAPRAPRRRTTRGGR